MGWYGITAGALIVGMIWPHNAVMLTIAVIAGALAMVGFCIAFMEGVSGILGMAIVVIAAVWWLCSILGSTSPFGAVILTGAMMWAAMIGGSVSDFAWHP